MFTLIKTKDLNAVKKFFKKLYLPEENSHKGQNGKVLIIGGSSLFHAASLWAAEVASYFVDMVHYSSTEENQKIFLNLKTKFRNGIVVSKKDLLSYVKEDDVILVGPGMIRKNISNIKNQISKIHIKNQKELINIRDEGLYTYFLTKFLIDSFPEKKFVFDAGALQMMEKAWLLKLKTPAIITPHQKEFEQLFGKKILNLDFDKKIDLVRKYAKKYQVIILLKAIKDIVSDGERVYVIEGGNAGLTKGGTGDLLAGLTASFYCKNSVLMSAVMSSVLFKKTADELYEKFKYWYNIDNLIKTLPKTLSKII